MPFLQAPHQIGRREGPFKCSGGTETIVGNTKVHTFLTSDIFRVLSGEGVIDCLLVGGGGGYPNVNYNAGCGAGGMLTSTNNAVSKGDFTVTVGAGGANGNGTNTYIADSSGTSIGAGGNLTFVPSQQYWWYGDSTDYTFGTGTATRNNGTCAIRSILQTGLGDFTVSFTVSDATAQSFGFYPVSDDSSMIFAQWPYGLGGQAESSSGNMTGMTVSYWHSYEAPTRAQYSTYSNSANRTYANSTSISNNDNIRYERRSGEIKLYVNNTLTYTYPETTNDDMRFVIGNGGAGSLSNIEFIFQGAALGGGGGQQSPMSGASGQGGLDGNVGEGFSGQGNDGGNGARSGEGASLGGGGGAGAVGGAGSPPPRRSPGTPAGGAGGIGLENNYRTGSNIFYAGGGAGNASSEGQMYAYDPPAQGGGGSGGGASGAGTVNTGGGGAGGQGGSGIVVIRYTTT